MKDETNIEFWRGEVTQRIDELARQLSKHDLDHKEMNVKQEEILQKVDKISLRLSESDSLIEKVKSLQSEVDKFKGVYLFILGIIATISFILNFFKEQFLNIFHWK